MTNVGQYYFAKHRNKWGVWKVTSVTNGVEHGQFICDFQTKIQAQNFCNKMNAI